MKTIKYFLCLLLPMLAITSCKDDSIVENPSGETIIYNIFITNGGLAGSTRYAGVVDMDSKTVTFNDVAIETDLQNLKFGGKISLGANFDKESYNFLEGQPNAVVHTLTQPIRLISGKNITDYEVTLNLKAPQAKPMVGKLEVQTGSGRTVVATIDLTDKMIYLNTPSESEVTLKSISVIPLRTTYSFTNLSNNKLSKDNPGSIELDFLGITDRYQIFFDEAPAAGINFGVPIIHDFSLRTGNLYPDFTAEDTRSADLDNEHILIVSRAGGTRPYLLRVRDVMAGNANLPIALKTTGIAGGTFPVSYGRLTQGRIYVCNLSTGLADSDVGKLKIYYWETPTSDPELILDFSGIVNEVALSTGRFGDNMSIDLDEKGDGYVYFVHQSANETLRFTVTGFTTVSDPIMMKPGDAFYYAFYNRIGLENEYLYTSTVAAVIKLLDKDGNELAQIDKLTHGTTMNATRGTNARVINYNSGRYLIMTSGRQQNAWPFPALFIYDITEGFNTQAAFVKFKEKQPDPVFFYQMGEPAASGGCAGIAAWAPIDGKLCILAASPRSGFVLIEFPKNQK